MNILRSFGTFIITERGLVEMKVVFFVSCYSSLNASTSKLPLLPTYLKYLPHRHTCVFSNADGVILNGMSIRITSRVLLFINIVRNSHLNRKLFSSLTHLPVRPEMGLFIWASLRVIFL